MTIEVITQDVFEAARNMESVSRGVKDADPSGDLAPLANALPGSQSAAAATELADAWRQRFRSWASDALTQRDNLNLRASSYDAADHAAAVRAQALREKLQMR